MIWGYNMKLKQKYYYMVKSHRGISNKDIERLINYFIILKKFGMQRGKTYY